jgi:hypothetical protein
MTSVLALTETGQSLWLLALGLGAVVLVVVVALLTALLRLVTQIDEGVREVWETAGRAAANTATTWQLERTCAALEQLDAEAVRHQELLDGRR